MNLEKIRSILPNRVRSFRNSKNLTQEQLAERVDIHPTYISRIESGKKLPTLVIICKLADALGINAYELLIDEAKAASSQYKIKKIINMINEAKPADVDTYMGLLNVLRKNRKK
ncbi:MAG: helix-turn-helix transcriptional regulator [Candidatus Omnitrophica bacterium]|nr:helix-turn-helix transcriptional regulator [Candidatus Omnitrophota bacterium]